VFERLREIALLFAKEGVIEESLAGDYISDERFMLAAIERTIFFNIDAARVDYESALNLDRNVNPLDLDESRIDAHFGDSSEYGYSQGNTLCGNIVEYAYHQYHAKLAALESLVIETRGNPEILAEFGGVEEFNKAAVRCADRLGVAAELTVRHIPIVFGNSLERLEG